jgi:hypothetical protein
MLYSFMKILCGSVLCGVVVTPILQIYVDAMFFIWMVGN